VKEVSAKDKKEKEKEKVKEKEKEEKESEELSEPQKKKAKTKNGKRRKPGEVHESFSKFTEETAVRAGAWMHRMRISAFPVLIWIFFSVHMYSLGREWGQGMVG
jgi:uncharacterized membrane protein